MVDAIYLMNLEYEIKELDIVRTTDNKIKVYDYDNRCIRTFNSFSRYAKNQNVGYIYKSREDDNFIKSLIIEDKFKKIESKYLFWKEKYDTIKGERDGIQQSVHNK